MKKKILLVEYATSTIETIKGLLSHPIFEISVVNEGDTAKEQLMRGRYDMLITAAMLPKFHGFNLSQFTGQTYPETRIIIISEIYKGMDYKHQATTQYRADDFFEKPFDPEIFKNRVFELLNITNDSIPESPATPTVQIPVHDTKKIPTIDSLEEESKKMTSQDLFGDIIDQVQDSDSGYEIKLNTDTGPHEIPTDIPPVTHIIPQQTQPINTKTPTAPPASIVTQPISVSNVKPEVVETETRPEEIFPILQKKAMQNTAKNSDTKEIPAVTQLMEQVSTKNTNEPPSPLTTQKIDLDILGLLDKDSKKHQKPQAPNKSKKIEADISNRLEETLSGLGLTSPAKGAKRPPQKKDAARHRQEKKIATPPPPVKPLKPTAKAADMPPISVTGAPTTEAIKKTEVINPYQPPVVHNEEMGGYEILGQIGRGGMAEIYKAKKRGVKGFEKLIALKKIISGYGADAKYIEMFVDEAKIAAQLSHSNIVEIYDLGKKDDYYFIAMEYIAGKDLRNILNSLNKANTTMPEELAVYLIIKILEALNYAHNAKAGDGKPLEIVHRDVSPPNILVSYNGNIKLTDFGVSKASIKMHHTVAGALKGKLLYMSPEQAKGDENIDYRSDLYSVGIILFELLTGVKLFMGSSDIGTLTKVQEGKIIRPRQVKKDISPQLEAIILKSLDKNIEGRFQKASDMVKALDTYMIKNYDNMPDTSHMSHFIYTLYKSEIIEKKIEINLKPIPYSIKKRIKKTPPIQKSAPITPSPASKPVPKPTPQPAATPEPQAAPAPPPMTEPPEPITLPETTMEIQPPAPEQPKSEPLPPVSMPETLELPPAPSSPSTAPEKIPGDEPEILELTEEQHIIENPMVSGTSAPSAKATQGKEMSRSEFQPIIEINFDDEKEEPKPAASTLVESISSKPAAIDQPVSLESFAVSEPAPVSKKKKNLVIAAVAIIIILAALIIFLLMNRPSSGPDPAGTPSVSTRVSEFSAEPETSPETGDIANTGENTDTQDVGNLPVAEAGTPVEESGIIPTGKDTGKSRENISTPPGVQDRKGSKKSTKAGDVKPDTIAKDIKKTKKNRKKNDIEQLGPTPAENKKDQKQLIKSDKKNEDPGIKDDKQADVTSAKEQLPATTDTDNAGKTMTPLNTQPETTVKKAATTPEIKTQSTPPPPVESPKPPVNQPTQPTEAPVKEGDILSPTIVDTKAELISNPQIKLSRSIKRLLVSNQRVLVSFLVNHHGKVEIVKLIKKTNMKKLNDLIVNTIKKWKFKPATKNNVKVKVWKNKWLAINKK